MSSHKVIEFARGMIGTPWRHQGRKPWAVDCAGLVVLSFSSAGWKGANDSPAKYGRDPWDDMLRKTLNGFFGEPINSEWDEGDVALYAFGKGEPSHVGIIANHPDGGLSLIHSSNLEGVIESRMSFDLVSNVIEVYRPDWNKNG